MKLPKAFLTDLRAVQEFYAAREFGDASETRSSPTKTTESFLRLEQLLIKHREETRARVDARRAVLSKDHVLFCPVGLFGPIGLGRRETAYTRTLAWLLNPSPEIGGDHGFGAAILEALMHHLTGLACAGSFTVVSVDAEHPLAGGATARSGRADILVQGGWSSPPSRGGGRFKVVIEAKIDANEGEDQLSRYEKALEPFVAGGGKVFYVYLTPDGRDEHTAGRDWENLSFMRLARILTHCADRLRDCAGYPILRLFIVSLLRDVDRIGSSALDSLYAMDEYLNEFEA